MINAKEIIKFDRTEEELQELILFLIAVAGKKADTVAGQLDRFLKFYNRGIDNPFKAIKNVEKYNTSHKEGVSWIPHQTFEASLKNFGFGCQTRLARAFKEVANKGLDLKTCSLDDLMEVHGIGRKSASCFLAWTRKKVNVAMLDTHLMKYIRFELGYEDAPKATPSSKKQYDYYEKIYLDHCKKLKVNPTEYDLKIWKKYAYKEKI